MYMYHVCDNIWSGQVDFTRLANQYNLISYCIG